MKNRPYVFIRRLILTLGLAWFLFAAGAVATDLDVLFDRLKADLIADAAQNPDSLARVPNDLATMNPDGSWSDIDYTSTQVANWPSLDHVLRLGVMAGAYHVSTNEYYHDPALLAKIISGLDFWYQTAPTSDNWWYRDVGKQLYLGPICILLRDELSQSRIDEINVDLHRPVNAATGQNLIWDCQKLIWAGAIMGYEPDVITGRNGMVSTLTLAEGTAEGIKRDGSFWQHGAMLATLSYGMVSFVDLSHWAARLSNLPYSFSQEEIDLLSVFALDGVQWASRYGSGDHAAIGRSIARQPIVDYLFPRANAALSLPLTTGCDNMMIADPPRAALYQNFKSNVEGTLGGNVNGNRHYWLSDFNVHRRSGYMAGLKIASTRTKIPESVNGENLHGFYQGVGSMTLLLDGDEYLGIFPVWDWGLYPGTTTRHRTPGQPGSRTGTTAFAGGAADGTYGAVGYDMNWDGVTGKKAWFFFDNEFVALGSDITSSATEEICTTLNQCNRDGDVRVEYGSGSGSIMNDGTQVLSNPKWVHHDKVGYIFPQNNEATLKMADQTGSWYEISSSHSNDMITNAVFSLYLNHGVNPSGAEYQYLVMPDSTPADVQSAVAANEVDVVANTAAIQAVYHQGLSRGGIVFYQAGSVTLRSGFSVTANVPCILLVDESDAQNIKLTASNPKNQALVLLVDTVIDGDAKRTVMVLPGGEYAGSSLTRSVGTNPGTPPSGITVRFPVSDPVSRQLGTVTLAFLMDATGQVILDASTSSQDSGAVAMVDAWDGWIGSVTQSVLFNRSFSLIGQASVDGVTTNGLIAGSAVSGLGVSGLAESRLDRSGREALTWTLVGTGIQLAFSGLEYTNRAPVEDSNLTLLDGDSRVDYVLTNTTTGGTIDLTGAGLSIKPSEGLVLKTHESTSADAGAALAGFSIVAADYIPPVTGEMVLNGSFENGGTAPTSWTLSGSVGSTESAQQGVQSLRIAKASSGVSKQTIAITNGTTYNLSLWVNSSGLTGGNVVFDTNDRYDAAGQGQFVINAAKSGWINYSGRFTATNNTALTLRIFSSSTFSGVVYFDNISLTPVVVSNLAPVFISSPVTTGQAGQLYSYTLQATDAENDSMVFSVVTNPPWLSFNPVTRVLSGTPSAADVGSHSVAVRVSDGTLSADQVFVIQVTAAGVVPGASLIGSFTTNGAMNRWDLSGLGRSDWAYWNTASPNLAAPVEPTNEKSGGNLISSLSGIGGTTLRGSSSSWTTADFSFTNGTSVASGDVDNLTGLFNSVLVKGNGISCTVDLPTTDTYRLYIWVSAYNCAGQMTIRLDGATDYVHSNANANSKPSWVYTVDVKANRAGDDVTIQYVTTGSVASSPHAIISAIAISAVSGYDAWALTAGFLGGPLDDDDLDGLDNLSEYAISEKPVLTKSVDAFTYVYKQRTDDPNLSYELQTCTDLTSGSWTNVGYTILGTNVTGGTYNDVTHSIPTTEPQAYIRLRITDQ